MPNNVPIILAIDFDETIAINSPFPNIISFIEGANVYIRKLFDEGYYIIINTCRTGVHAQQAIDFLHLHNVPFHQFNENHPSLINFYEIDCRKISADVYVDDKCIMGLPSWEEIYNRIVTKEFLHPCLSFTHKTESICQ